MQSLDTGFSVKKTGLFFMGLFSFLLITAQTPTIYFKVSFPEAKEHLLDVEMNYDPKGKKIIDFELP
ncbi:MAG: hypothetical protein ACN4EP_13470, partial [Sediminibacterium sp.]